MKWGLSREHTPAIFTTSHTPLVKTAADSGKKAWEPLPHTLPRSGASRGREHPLSTCFFSVPRRDRAVPGSLGHTPRPYIQVYPGLRGTGHRAGHELHQGRGRVGLQKQCLTQHLRGWPRAQCSQGHACCRLLSSQCYWSGCSSQSRQDRPSECPRVCVCYVSSVVSNSLKSHGL